MVSKGNLEIREFRVRGCSQKPEASGFEADSLSGSNEVNNRD